MASTKITALTAAGSVAATDILPIVTDLGTTPVTKKATAAQVVTAGIGTASSQAAAGNHTHTGVTPATHGNEAHSVAYIPAGSVTYELINANGDAGTASGQLAIGNHTHTGLTPETHGNEAHTSTFITATDVTFANLSANGAVGAAGTQVAQGDHTHTGNVPLSTIDAAGDLLVGTGNDTVGRLALGTAGYAFIARAGTPAWEAQKVGVSFVMGDNATAITTGIKGDFEMPFAGTITAVRLLGGTVAGTLAVDIWKDTCANYPPTQTDSICGTNVPTISGTTIFQDTGLTGWSATAFSAGDIFTVNVGTAAAITRCTLALTTVRT